MHRQLTPYENQLLHWAKTERDHAIYARFDDAFKATTHGAQSIRRESPLLMLDN